jgi:hypothetical protein
VNQKKKKKKSRNVVIVIKSNIVLDVVGKIAMNGFVTSAKMITMYIWMIGCQQQSHAINVREYVVFHVFKFVMNVQTTQILQDIKLQFVHLVKHLKILDVHNIDGWYVKTTNLKNVAHVKQMKIIVASTNK